jgi:hypothetical protein
MLSFPFWAPTITSFERGLSLNSVLMPSAGALPSAFYNRRLSRPADARQRDAVHLLRAYTGTVHSTLILGP